MGKKLFIIFLLCSLCITLFCSCSSNQKKSDEKTGINKETVIKYAYSEKKYPIVTDPYSGTSMFVFGCIELELGEDIYCFAPEITDEDKDNFVNCQFKLEEYLKQKNTEVSKKTIYVLENYINRTESDENRAFYDVNTAGTYNQVLTTLQLIYGDYTNYGFLYAMANHIAEALGWVQDDTVNYDQALVQFLRDNPEYLSLAYPCFDKVYSTDEAIKYSKMLALLLFDNSNEQSESAFTNQAQIFAKENNIEYTPDYFKFAYNGSTCPLKLKTKYIELFRHSSYIDEKDYSKYLDNRLTNYKEMLDTLKLVDKDIEMVRNIFNFTSEATVETLLCDEETIKARYGIEVGGYYSSGTNMITMVTFSALTHEYIHHIIDELNGESLNPQGWNNEVLAHYYGILSDLLNSTMKNRFNDEYVENKKWFEDTFGKEYTDKDDYILLAEFDCYENQIYSCLSGVSWYLMFANYFVETYGEDMLIPAMLHPSEFEKKVGKDFQEIFNDCKINLIAKYSS